MSAERFKPATDEEIARRRFAPLYGAILEEAGESRCEECGSEENITLGGTLCLPCQRGGGPEREPIPRTAARIASAGTSTVHLRANAEAEYTLCGLFVDRSYGGRSRRRCRKCRNLAPKRGLALPPAWEGAP